MTVLRRAYVPVEPDVSGFDEKLKTDLTKQDPGGKAGKQIGGQLNRALKRLDLDPIDIKANPRQAFLKIRETEEKLRRLSGDSATVEVKIKTERALSELGRFKKKLGDAGKDDDAGARAAEGFASGFTQRLGSLLEKAPLSPQLVIAAAAAAPVIGATISAAVIGAAGVGGVVGGLLLVKDDPRVQQAATAIGQKLLGALKADAQPFVEPVLVAAAKIEARFDAMEGRIQHIFATSSGFLQPLVDGALDGVDGILKGIDSLVTEGKPVIDALGNSFSIIGTSVGKAMTLISGDSEDAASALTNTAKAVGFLIESVGGLIRALTEVYGVVSYLPGKFKELEFHAAGLVGINKDVSKSAGDAATSVAAQVAALARNSEAAAAAARANGLFVASQADVKAAQDAAKVAQDDYNASITAMSPAGGRAAQVADGLRKAIDALHGAQVSATDANESYEASWDALTEAIQKNGRSLNIHTAAGRSNRDALEAVAAATRDGYVADVNAGIGITEATKKHDKRIAALKEEAKRSGLDRAETEKLVSTYGSIPKGKTTKLVVAGVDQIVGALKDLYVFQRSLADGIPVASEIAKLNEKKGPAKRYGGFAEGGQIGGWSPHARADNIPAMLTAKEWVHPVDAVDYYGPQIMGAIQHRQVPREVLAGFASGRLGKMGDLPVFASGGLVAPIDTSSLWKFVATMAHTRIPSKSEVASKVPIGAGPAGAFVRAQNGKPYIWADAGPDGYDCSGIVSAVYNVLHGKSPYSHTFSTGSLPGRWFPKHGIGGPLTAAWSNPGESPASSTTGHMMGMVGGLTFESTGSRGVHLGASTRRLTDFAHIGHYARGGEVGAAPLFDGGGTLAPGFNTVFNGLGRPEPLVPAEARGDIHIHIHDSVIASKRHAEDLVVAGYNAARAHRRIP